MEQVALLAYVCVGPLAWAGVWAGMLLGRSRMNRLEKRALPLPDDAPRVTIVVPAKDEAAGIRACVKGLLTQDYPSYDVRVIDDRSTDGTAEILDELAANGSFVVQHIQKGELPPGWLGKCHALHQGTRDVTSPWLLFVDSDVTLDPHALRDTMALALARKYDVISLLTRLRPRSYWERSIIPLAAGVWGVMFQISLTNDDNKTDWAFANGQFILVRRDFYEKAGNHEAVKGDICEDCALMQRMKKQGAKVRFLSGSRLVSITMHATLHEIKKGWGRIYAGSDKYRRGKLIGALLFLTVAGLSVYPALAWGGVFFLQTGHISWLTAGVAHFVLLTSMLAYVYSLARMNRLLAFAWPVSAMVLIRVLLYGLVLCKKRTIEWRGTVFKASS